MSLPILEFYEEGEKHMYRWTADEGIIEGDFDEFYDHLVDDTYNPRLAPTENHAKLWQALYEICVQAHLTLIVEEALEKELLRRMPIDEKHRPN